MNAQDAAAGRERELIAVWREDHRDSMARFGEGLKAVEAVARRLV